MTSRTARPEMQKDRVWTSCFPSSFATSPILTATIARFCLPARTGSGLATRRRRRPLRRCPAPRRGSAFWAALPGGASSATASSAPTAATASSSATTAGGPETTSTAPSPCDDARDPDVGRPMLDGSCARGYLRQRLFDRFMYFNLYFFTSPRSFHSIFYMYENAFVFVFVDRFYH